MNRLAGTIPKEIFQLYGLTTLYLTENSLHGSLPHEVSIMTQLETMMLIAKRPTDEIFKEGLSLSIFVSAMDENEVLKVADRRLIDDYEYSTQSSSTGDHSSSFGGNTRWTHKAEE
ncbi:hypothetical protein JHK85_011409 [Glycine max]|nr:hypothetical protein JHK85_011409 [Glycine max]